MSKARDIARAGTALTNVDATELGYLDGVTSNVQTQLDAKQAANANVSTTELGYLDGVTSAIQTQLNTNASAASTAQATADAAIPKSTATTKGDLLAATAASTVTRLGVGTNNQTLLADSTTSTGLKWAASPQSLMTSKGDIIAATAANTPSNLAVGTDGQTLVANSSQTTGLGWANNFAVGKNKIINGDFGIWQRGTSFTSIANGAYAADRFFHSQDGSNTCTVSQQTFTAGTAPVAGYEGQYFWRTAITSTGTLTFMQVGQRMENVRTFAGQTITISFWAKGSSNATGLVYTTQNFGSGGSADVETGYPTFALTTSWTRYAITLNIPSVAGKTIGTGSFIQVFIRSGLTANGATFDVWGVQVEAGSVATAFQTATGTIQGELAACQRYYYRAEAGDVYQRFGQGIGAWTDTVYMLIPFPVTMRVTATSMDYSNVSTLSVWDSTNTVAVSGMTHSPTTNKMGGIYIAMTSGGVQYRPYMLMAKNNSTAYVGFSAEL